MGGSLPVIRVSRTSTCSTRCRPRGLASFDGGTASFRSAGSARTPREDRSRFSEPAQAETNGAVRRPAHGPTCPTSAPEWADVRYHVRATAWVNGDGTMRLSSPITTGKASGDVGSTGRVDTETYRVSRDCLQRYGRQVRATCFRESRIRLPSEVRSVARGGGDCLSAPRTTMPPGGGGFVQSVAMANTREHA